MGGVIGTLFGGSTSRERRQNNEFEAAFGPLIQQQSANMGFASGEAKKSLGQFGDAIKGPQDYWSTILSGDEKAIMELLGPESSAVETAYENQAKNNAQFNPRGGGEVTQNSALQADKLKTLGDMIMKLRPEAANQLSSIASLFANLGLGEINAATGAGGSAIGGLLQNRSLNLGAQQNRIQNLNQQMQGIGQLLAMI